MGKMHQNARKSHKDTIRILYEFGIVNNSLYLCRLNIGDKGQRTKDKGQRTKDKG